MMLIAIQRKDSGVSIMRLIAQPLADAVGEVTLVFPFVDDEIVKWKQSHPGEYVSHHALDEADVPTDRTYRNSWVSDGKRIGHDMIKARDLHREKMRIARKAKLEALDIEYQRADESGNGALKAAIAAEKQALRDITSHPGIETAQTIDELKAVWPGSLK